MLRTPAIRGTGRDRLLDAALRLFYAHGPRAVGVDNIIAESGVSKATFYHHFPSKEDLVLAYLNRVDESWLGDLRAAARAAGTAPRDQLLGMFDALTAACRREDFHGCGFINAAAESDAGSPVHLRAVEHKRVVRAWVSDLARRAGAPQPDLLARQLTLLLDGGLTSGVLGAEPDAPDAARAAAAVLIETALAPGGELEPTTR